VKKRDWRAEAELRRVENARRAQVMKRMGEFVYQLAPGERPYGQRGVYPKPPYYPKNADGLTPCRWCRTPTKRGWCSQDCVAEFMRRGHWPTMARFITKRDKVCRLCGGQRSHVTEARPHFDVDSCRTWTHVEWTRMSRDAAAGLEDRRPWACRLEYTWAVDHIVAVKEGGTDDPANLRLLCGRCHNEVSAEQAARWAAERRAAVASTSGQVPLL
jgi:5-methylcytosine-specific restriction endonuclease McrA